MLSGAVGDVDGDGDGFVVGRAVDVEGLRVLERVGIGGGDLADTVDVVLAEADFGDGGFDGGGAQGDGVAA